MLLRYSLTSSQKKPRPRSCCRIFCEILPSVGGRGGGLPPAARLCRMLRPCVKGRGEARARSHAREHSVPAAGAVPTVFINCMRAREIKHRGRVFVCLNWWNAGRIPFVNLYKKALALHDSRKCCGVIENQGSLFCHVYCHR